MYGAGVRLPLSLLPFSLNSFTYLIRRSSVVSAVSVVTFYYYFPFNIALVLLLNTYSTLMHSLDGSSWRIIHTGDAMCLFGLA